MSKSSEEEEEEEEEEVSMSSFEVTFVLMINHEIVYISFRVYAL
jgi:hypothetical protein